MVAEVGPSILVPMELGGLVGAAWPGRGKDRGWRRRGVKGWRRRGVKGWRRDEERGERGEGEEGRRWRRREGK
jgi:hypothetical protein